MKSPGPFNFRLPAVTQWMSKFCRVCFAACTARSNRTWKKGQAWKKRGKRVRSCFGSLGHDFSIDAPTPSLPVLTIRLLTLFRPSRAEPRKEDG